MNSVLHVTTNALISECFTSFMLCTLFDITADVSLSVHLDALIFKTLAKKTFLEFHLFFSNFIIKVATAENSLLTDRNMFSLLIPHGVGIDINKHLFIKYTHLSHTTKRLRLIIYFRFCCVLRMLLKFRLSQPGRSYRKNGYYKKCTL